MPVKGVPRAPHKEGCMCISCKWKREKLEALIEPEVEAPIAEPEIVAEPEMAVEPEIVAPPPPPVPTEVKLDSLPPATKFEYKGERHQVNEKIPGMVVCYNLFCNDIVTLGGSTMVKPIE